jgi:SPP1 family predicted phage head-tail adaptor
MRAGRLRERITIQQESIVRDTFGAEVPTWVAVATVWASVLPGSSGERYVSTVELHQAEISHTVRIRYRSGLGPTLRVLWGSRVLQILSVVDPTGRQAELVLLCREIVDGEVS